MKRRPSGLCRDLEDSLGAGETSDEELERRRERKRSSQQMVDIVESQCRRGAVMAIQRSSAAQRFQYQAWNVERLDATAERQMRSKLPLPQPLPVCQLIHSHLEVCNRLAKRCL